MWLHDVTTRQIFGLINGPSQRYFEHEIHTAQLKHDRRGLLVMAALGAGDEQVHAGAGKEAQPTRRLANGSQFFFTLGDRLDYLDGKYTIFGIY